MLQRAVLPFMAKEDIFCLLPSEKKAIPWILPGFTDAIIHHSKGNLMPHPTGSPTA